MFRRSMEGSAKNRYDAKTEQVRSLRRFSFCIEIQSEVLFSAFLPVLFRRLTHPLFKDPVKILNRTKTAPEPDFLNRKLCHPEHPFCLIQPYFIQIGSKRLSGQFPGSVPPNIQNSGRSPGWKGDRAPRPAPSAKTVRPPSPKTITGYKAVNSSNHCFFMPSVHSNIPGCLCR